MSVTKSEIKAQLDQIESKLDRIGLELGLVTREQFDNYHPGVLKPLQTTEGERS